MLVVDLHPGTGTSWTWSTRYAWVVNASAFEDFLGHLSGPSVGIRLYLVRR